MLRAGLLAWGGWLLVTAATFSFMAGIFHAYYTVALAPAIAAVVAIVAVGLWRHSRTLCGLPRDGSRSRADIIAWRSSCSTARPTSCPG